MYDIIVAGGGTSGCAAAYIAGKAGLKVLLIEKNIHLGGSITSGLVVPVMKSGENQINTEFYNALISELSAIGGQVTYQENNGWFNPELTKIALDRLMEKASVDVILGASVFSVQKAGRDIISISINSKILSEYSEQIDTNNNYVYSHKILSEPIGARYFVDATGNCEIGKLSDCEFLDEKDENQPVSLRFVMSGVDLEVFGKWLLEIDKDREVTSVEVINGETHLSTAYTWDNDRDWALAPFFDDAVNKNIIKDYDRNYFQVFTIAGMPGAVAFNCPRLVDTINPLNILDTSMAVKYARSSILRLSKFCKTYFPGFEKAYISNIADMLGVRVSRRIKGKYIYTEDDIISHKTFEHPVLISNYPIDVHSAEKDASILNKTSDYQVPIESLMSADIDNLFVVGRCISADFRAQAALRVQASCFSMGEGAAKYIANLMSY